MYDLVFKNAEVLTPAGLHQTDVAVADGKIIELGQIDSQKTKDVVDCKGLTILPGVIDTQVHFREPGLTHKEDIESGTRGAALGGVTGICEMPNTKPLTLTRETFAEKMEIARKSAWCNYAFFIGGAAENVEELPELERLPGCAGVKIFMGSSTGSLLVEDEKTLAEIMKHGRRRVAVHAEDEARLKQRQRIAVDAGHPQAHPQWRDEEAALMATQRIVKLARAANRPVHVLHITTAEEMAFLKKHKDIATVEVTPQHLTFYAPDCYETLGTRAQMNPPIREKHHQEALWRALEQGVVDVIGSDHAPHTLEEKQKSYPQSPSGMTGVQTYVPVMLDHVSRGRLSLERFCDLSAAGPARVLGMQRKGRIVAGYDADLTIVDLAKQEEITDAWIASKSGWTPYAGRKVKGWPVMTVVGGHIIMRDGALLTRDGAQNINFL